MPEMWLKYGSTEIVLDIKAENLLDYVFGEEQNLSDEQISSKLAEVPVNTGAHIVILEPSIQIAKLSLALVDSIRSRGIDNIVVDVPLTMINMYRSVFQEKNVMVSKLSNSIGGIDNAILLSRTAFDPLFGYAGAPTQLIRYLGNGEMLDAYKTRDNDLPNPGSVNNALSVAHRFVDKVNSVSIECIFTSQGLLDIIINKPVDAHKEAISRLESTGSIEVERSKAVIVSSGDGYSTLSHAFNSLWNCLDAVRDEGSITLLAECRDGFGSRALQMLVEGKISMDDAHRSAEYIDGLENLLYLKEVSERYKISLVSSLPDYYTKHRLGLKTHRRTRDVLQNILGAYGPRQKVLVVSDASKVLLRRKASS
jgi:hypothetical protein